MRIFDLHADIGADIYEKYHQNKQDILKMNHFPKLIKGDVYGVTMACFFSGIEDWATMQDMVLKTGVELNATSEHFRWVKTADDLITDDKILAIISVEGMCGIIDNVSDKIDWLYDHGIRIGSLCWNESNRLAEGWPNNPLKGLTELGIEAIKQMNKRKMIVDVSHTNEKTFWDIVSYSQTPIIATHSNARSLCDHQRNLTDQQIKAIGLKGGLIGLNAAKSFIHKDPAEQTVFNLALHGRYIADLIGYEHLALGFDFMDFLPDKFIGSMANDMTHAGQSQRMIKALGKVGFSQKEVEAIAYNNVELFLKRYL